MVDKKSGTIHIGNRRSATVRCKCGYSEKFNSANLAKEQIKWHRSSHLPRHYKVELIKNEK